MSLRGLAAEPDRGEAGHAGAREEIGNDVAPRGKGLNEGLDCADRNLGQVAVTVINGVGARDRDGFGQVPSRISRVSPSESGNREK